MSEFIFLLPALWRARKHDWAHWKYFQSQRLSGALRTQSNKLFTSVCNCYEPFLGNLPKPWRMRVLQPRDGRKLFYKDQMSKCFSLSNVFHAKPRCRFAFLFSSTMPHLSIQYFFPSIFPLDNVFFDPPNVFCFPSIFSSARGPQWRVLAPLQLRQACWPRVR